MPTYVEEIAAQVAEGRLDALVNGTLFRSIRGVQSKLELINTPNVLESLSRCACMFERSACAASLASSAVWPQVSALQRIYSHCIWSVGAHVTHVYLSARAGGRCLVRSDVRPHASFRHASDPRVLCLAQVDR